jgi:hypothetical protein
MGSFLLTAVWVLVPMGATRPADDAIEQAKFVVPLLAFERNGGIVPPTAAAYYTFTVSPDGLWEFKPTKTGQVKKGRIPPEELKRWIKEIEDRGLFRLTGNENLGNNDEPYLLAEMNKEGMKHRVKIMLGHPEAVRVDKKIVEMVKPVEK